METKAAKRGLKPLTERVFIDLMKKAQRDKELSVAMKNDLKEGLALKGYQLTDDFLKAMKGKALRMVSRPVGQEQINIAAPIIATKGGRIKKVTVAIDAKTGQRKSTIA